jgi:uncharacterized protein (TIGR03084 family)
VNVIDDLVAEYDNLESILASLNATQWLVPSGAPGWTIRDVVVHLWATEQQVVSTLQRPSQQWTKRDDALDNEMDRTVRADTASPQEVLERWSTVRRASVEALRNADPNIRVAWAAAPLRPATLATTRLAEHWAHMLDIALPLGIVVEDTNRLRHIAWLGHSTLPYAFGLHGELAPPIRVELVLPEGDLLVLGPHSNSIIRGPIGEFCRVGAQRMRAADSSLTATNKTALRALQVLRNYAL